MEADLHQQPSEGMQEALWCSSGLVAVYAANTWLKHCHNTAQHFTTRCPMLLNPAQQHCSTPLKPSAQQRTCILLHHLHPLVPLSSSSCKSLTLWRSTVASPLSKGPHSKRALSPIPSVSSHNSQTALQQQQTHFLQD